jgi:hypothetical protein
MMWDKWVGPATLVYAITATFGAIWWASDLSARLHEAEGKVHASAMTADRLTRVETLLIGLDKQIDKIDAKLDRQSR